MVTGELEDTPTCRFPTCGLVSSQTGQVTDCRLHGLVIS